MRRAAVPEATVHKDRYPASWKNNVRRASLGEATMQTESSAGGVECFTKCDFRSCVLFDAAAQVSAALGRDPVVPHASRLDSLRDGRVGAVGYHAGSRGQLTRLVVIALDRSVRALW